MDLEGKSGPGQAVFCRRESARQKGWLRRGRGRERALPQKNAKQVDKRALLRYNREARFSAAKKYTNNMKGMMTMKSMFKRAAAGVMALAMCAGLAGCYSEDKTWAAKMGDDTMPIGGYIYYLTSAYTDGAAKVDSGSEVFKSQIDGQSAESWVEDRALDYLRSYYFVTRKFDELGLTLSEEDQDAIQSATSAMWSYYKTPFESMGIAESSFEKAYSVYNQKLSTLLSAMYGEGGELALGEDEMKQYYLDGYTYYQYFSIPLTKTDDEGNTVDMDEDEKLTEKQMLEDWAQEVTKGSISFDQAMDNYKNSHNGAEPTTGEPLAVSNDSMSDLFKDAIFPLKNDGAAVVDATSRLYLVQKLDINEDFKALLDDEDRTNTLLRTMKAQEFLDYTMEQGKSLGVEVNQKAIGAVRTTVVADTMGSNGTSSASSESTDASSQESSQEESQDESSEAGSEE